MQFLKRKSDLEYEKDQKKSLLNNTQQVAPLKQVSLIEENSAESTENSQSDVDHDIKERMLLVIIKLGAKPKYKNDKKYIKEGLEKIVTLV